MSARRDPVDDILEAIRRLGDGPEPAPDDALAAFLSERHAWHAGGSPGGPAAPAE